MAESLSGTGNHQHSIKEGGSGGITLRNRNTISTPSKRAGVAESLSGTGIPSALHQRGREWRNHSQEQEYHQHSIKEGGSGGITLRNRNTISTPSKRAGVAESLSGTGMPSHSIKEGGSGGITLRNRNAISTPPKRAGVAESLSGTGMPSALHQRGREWRNHSQEQEYHQHSIKEGGSGGITLRNRNTISTPSKRVGVAESLSGTGIPSALHQRGREWRNHSQEQEYHQHSIKEGGSGGITLKNRKFLRKYKPVRP